MALRPDLYKRLEQCFGSVEIIHEDEPIEATEMIDPYASEDEEGRVCLDVSRWGETYAICCPFCCDYKPRLHINHMWNYKVEGQRYSPYFHLVKCFNMECMKQPGRKRQLWEVIDDQLGQYSFNYVKPGKKRDKKKLDVVTPPGRLIRLSQLPETHDANKYLRSRDFDPLEIERFYRVTWCVDPISDEFSKAGNRLLIPIYMRNKAVGWQARAVDNSHPKYYNLRDMPKSDMLYNYDTALSYPYCVITEGVTDVWRIGPEAICLFGKTATPSQLNLISSAWRSKAVVLALDPDAKEQSSRLFYDLQRMVTKAVQVQLPEGKDPADLPREDIRKMIDDALTKQE